MALERLATGLDLEAMRERIAVIAGPVDPEVEEHYLVRARRENLEHRRAMSRRMSAIPAQFEGATLETYRRSPGNRRALAAADRVIKSDFRVGMGLFGDPGVGKSHLSAIVANAAIEAGHLTIFLSVRRMLDTIKDTYNAAYDRDEKDATELRMIKRYASIPVLVLNDLGKEQLTPWAISMLYAIMDDRWEHGRPLIVTANLDWPQLLARYQAAVSGVDESTGPAMMDRIAGMTGMPWVEITGESQRWA
jgi:DNA replication protein DnaC